MFVIPCQHAKLKIPRFSHPLFPAEIGTGSFDLHMDDKTTDLLRV